MGKVNTTTYKDQLAIAVENDSLRFLFYASTLRPPIAPHG